MEYVIVLTHTQIEFDSRIRRQILILSQRCNVILCCKKGTGENLEFLPANIEFFFYEEVVCQLGNRLLEVFLDQDPEKLNYITGFYSNLQINMNALSAYETYRVDLTNIYRKIYDFIRNDKICVKAIIANDVFVLPMAVRLKNYLKRKNDKVKLIGDMHEVHFDYLGDTENSNQKKRTWLCDSFLPRCDLISSVSDWGAQLYSKRYRRIPVVSIKNVANYHELSPKKPEEMIRLVHVGNAQKARRIEEMIKLMDYFDEKFVLDLYLVSSNEAATLYIKELQDLIDARRMQERIKILQPVVSEKLVETINQYDIGIFYIEPLIGNHKYILPNKLFEFIQGRVAVVTTPVQSMKELIERYDVGKVSMDYSLLSFAQAVHEVAEQLDDYKKNSNEAANDLNSAKEWKIILDYID